MVSSSSIVINTTKKQFDPKVVKPIHIRMLNEESHIKFKRLLFEKFGVKFVDIKPKIERPLAKEGINVVWEENVEWKYNEDLWEHYLLYCVDNVDRDLVGKVLDIYISPTEKSIWYPERVKLGNKDKVWKNNIVQKGNDNTKYPLYIISKGRWERRLTQESIERMNCDYFMVVEEDEYDKYLNAGVPVERLLKFTNEDKKTFTSGIYKDDGGSIPVRNFIWKHSLKNGNRKHWCIDDNIDGFYRWFKNCRYRCDSSMCFKSVEKWTDAHENVWLSGLNYTSFCPEISKRRVLCQRNTRVYSIILVSNEIPEMMNDEWKGDYIWRGKYNEDTDLSIRVLKSGGGTGIFNHFTGSKCTTMSCKGGNTSTIYQGDGLQKKLDSLIKQHPDIVKGCIKFKKIHHQVDYSGFKDITFGWNKLLQWSANKNLIFCRTRTQDSPDDLLQLYDTGVKPRVDKQKKYLVSTSCG